MASEATSDGQGNMAITMALGVGGLSHSGLEHLFYNVCGTDGWVGNGCILSDGLIVGNVAIDMGARCRV